MLLSTGAYAELAPSAPVAAIQLQKLTGKLVITSQLTAADLTRLKTEGFVNIIDMRPDGEAPDETPSDTMATTSESSGLKFSYIPVPHGDIPDEAVNQLGSVLSQQDGKTVLYCRTGRRAARTWGLYEASRKGGMDLMGILEAVRSTGQSADDLAPLIAKRIAARN
jgi:uncharacterized protein (TIGR01244 family)